MAFPSSELTIKVEAAFGADTFGDPDDWVWTDISDLLLRSEPITTSDGRAPLAAHAEPGTASFVLDGNDGDMVPLNPLSQYWPNVKLDLPFRITITGEFTGDIAAGFADTIDPVFTTTTDGVTCEIHVTIVGIVAHLIKGTSLPHSPMWRTMGGVAPGDYRPILHYSMEDAAGSTSFASGVAGRPAVPFGDLISPAVDDSLIGSEPLPTWTLPAAVALPVPGYSTTQWVTMWAVNIPSQPVVDRYMAQMYSTGTVARWAVILEPSATDRIALRAYDAGDTEIGSGATFNLASGDIATTADFYGHTFLMMVSAVQNGANIDFRAVAVRNDGLITAVASASTAGTVGVLTGDWWLYSGIDGTVQGHAALYVDTALSITGLYADPAADTNALAMAGHIGESASGRVLRVSTEAGYRVEITAGDSIAMGPQPIATEMEILQECERTDFAILGERNFGLLWVPGSARTNPTTALTVPLTTYRTSSGTQTAVLKPAYDGRARVDEWTIDKATGSQAIAGPADGDASRTDSRQINPQDDSYLAHAASLLQAQTSLDTFRWPQQPIDLGANPTLITAWLGVTLGVDRIVRTGQPAAFVSNAIDEIAYGRTQRIMPKSWTVTYSGAPARHWTAAVEGDDTLGKADTDGSTLNAAVSSGATTMLIATTNGTSPLWTTDGGEMPLPLIIAGETVSATAVAAPTTITFGAAGTAAHANNASVTPGIPASVAAGNLLLVLAAIRNSGTGVPDTPAGYTRMAVFPSDSNVQLFGKVAVGSDTAPTITFTGGAANADTSAQMCRIAGAFSAPDEALVVSNALLNTSAQDIAYPDLNVRQANNIIFYLAWKQDDWTSVASPGTEIGEPDTTTGSDQGIVWAYTIQTTATDIVAGVFTVTGGASAISRGAVCAIRSNVQSFTVTRHVNGVTKAQAAGEDIRLHPGAVAAY